MRRRGKVMKNSRSLSFWFLGLGLLGGCGGGNASAPPPAITVDLSPNSAQALDVNQSESFTARVSNDSSNQDVAWTVTCPAGVNSCGAMTHIKSASGASGGFPCDRV